MTRGAREDSLGPFGWRANKFPHLIGAEREGGVLGKGARVLSLRTAHDPIGFIADLLRARPELQCTNILRGRAFEIFLMPFSNHPHLNYNLTILAIMANIAPSVLRQASRLASHRTISAARLRNVQSLGRVASAPALPKQTRRTYVSQSRRDNAQVAEPKIETAIRLDKLELEKAGLALSGQEGSNVSVSPMAEVLQSAKLMDDGQRPIYLDMQATTPVDPRVLDAMLPYFVGVYGNPHSRTHAYGWESEKGVEEAREHIANLIGADPKEIIFTSGATESNNMSIKGVARFFGRSGKKKHIVTSQTEHKCVLDSCRHLQDEGFEVTYLPVQKNGLIDLKELEAAIRPDTALVSIMAVNNEIGVIQPLEKIGKMCREKKVFFHTDAAQAVGKIPIDVNAMNIDLLSISSHKIYGPKGIGACYVRRRPRVRLDPIISGGGQERGLRSGTLAPPLIVGFGEACRIAKEELEYDHKRVKALSDRLLNGLLAMEHTSQNGDADSFYPGCVNVSFEYVEGESLLMALKDIALSSGSACTSASLEPSYVLRALGNSDESAHSSIRFGIGRFTTEQEVDYVLKAVQERVAFLRELSPLWELVQDGIDLNTIQWSQH
ncbi:cysteine desulfurase-like protein [Thozetella sp. PMI_491]|nr:cysteine desulfurase-like protein [Thozetella sp. PMI_491]